MTDTDTQPQPSRLPAASFLVVGAGLLAGIALLTFHPIGAADTYLHMAAGQWILTHDAIPRHNLFMYTAQGHPWVDHTWLPQVIFVLIHRAFGPVGLQVYAVVFYAGAFGLMLWLWQRLCVGSHLAVLPFLVAILIPIGRYAPRPELFTDVFLAIAMALVITWRETHHRWIWALPPLTALWVNCHGGVTTGLIFLWAFVAGEGIQAAIAAKKPRAWLPALPFARWRTLALVAVASTAALVINPYGPGWVRAVSPSYIGFMSAYIDEWRPLLRPGVQMGAALPVIFIFMGAALATFFFSRRFYLSNLAAAIIFIGAAFQSQRHIVICALVLLAVMASNLSQRGWPVACPWVPSPKQTRWWLALVGAALWLVILAFAWGEPTLGWLGSQRRLGFGMEPNQLPVRAERFWSANRLPARLFDTVDDGGYIVWKRPANKPVFIDGLNAFGWPVVRQFQDIMAYGPAAEDLLRRWQINTFLLPQPDLARRPPDQRDIYSFLAESPEWKLVFWDGVSVIYVRDAPASRGLIERYGYRFLDPRDPRSPAYAQHRDEVAAELRRATAASPDAPYLRILAGTIYLQTGVLDQAADQFGRAIALDASQGQAYMGLGLAYAQASRMPDAEVAFREAARLDRSDPAPHRALAQVAETRGDIPAAVAEWRKVLARHPDPQTAEIARAALARLGAGAAR